MDRPLDRRRQRLRRRSPSTGHCPKGCAICCSPTRPRCAAWPPPCARLWSTWSYRELILPTFEYADTLATDVGAQIDAELYRFFDRQGRTLALRPDMTLPTARVVGTRLYDQPMPLRLCYVGSVFRHERPRAGRQHEFIQAGVELIGAAGHAADAEAIALAVASLRALGLPEFRITIGHVGFFHGLSAALALPDRLAGWLRLAVDRRSEAELVALLEQAGTVAATARRALLQLPRLTGPARSWPWRRSCV